MWCPNNCGELEREDYGATRQAQQNLKDSPSAIYHCESCDYTAIWTRGLRLKEEFPGVGRIEPVEDEWGGKESLL